MEAGGLTWSPWLASLGIWARQNRPAIDVALALQRFWPADGAGAPLSAGGRAIQPVPAAEPLGALAYEQHIARTGELPTRDNAHDWYNALVWLAFPKTRRVINHLQVTEGLASSGANIEAANRVANTAPLRAGSNGRTRRRDALTLLDENGAVLVTCAPVLQAALVDHDWQTFFVRHRALWETQAQVWVVGHAMLEKLEQPRIDLCAHVRIWLMDETVWADWYGLDEDARRYGLDAWLADDVKGNLQTPKDLQPLPLMGIPGWCADNADSDFYNNTTVFRPKRRP